MKNLLPRAPVVVNLKNKNFTSSFGSLRQKIAPKGVHVQHDSISSFNQSYRRCCRHRFVNSLMIQQRTALEKKLLVNCASTAGMR